MSLGMASALVYDGRRPCPALPFATFTLNVDEQCICLPHIDSKNLAGGLCLASPFGLFDHTQGGHLILHELKLVLEVPAGASVLFPSAIITHENVPIADHECRQSITAYTPGGLFQWLDHGFKVPNAKQSNFLKKLIISKLIYRYGGDVWRRTIRLLPHINTISYL